MGGGGRMHLKAVFILKFKWFFKDEQKQTKRKYERFDREKGHLDGDGLWYQEHPEPEVEEDTSDEEDEKEDLGLNEDEDSEDEDDADENVIIEVGTWNLIFDHLKTKFIELILLFILDENLNLLFLILYDSVHNIGIFFSLNIFIWILK